MLDKIKNIRNMTGAGVVDIKKALEEANGDEQKAIEVLRKKGLKKAEKKGDRTAKEGVIEAYLHTNGRVASLVKVYCETDFVARNDEFKELARDIAMHIAAMNPSVVKPEEVNGQLIEKEREIWIEQLKNEGKPENIIDNILQGKEAKFRSELALMTQKFVKNPEITVEQLVKEKIAKIGENIQIGDFARFEI
jgi:elongation factor Ts